MSQGPAPASIFAVELLAGLIRRGVQDVVVCPGSRSQALALAAAAAEEAGAVRLHVRVDERSAAFFALGIARETGLPAPVIVTSGTAVANLTPAAFEAHEGRVPFIALTADRPAALRGTRSNQTTTQFHMFGQAARLSLDVPPPGAQGGAPPDALAARALGSALGAPGDAAAGPVQLNLQFVEPLSGVAGFEDMIAAGFTAAAAEGAAARVTRALGAGSFSADSDAYVLSGDARTIVIAGAGAGRRATDFAERAGLPLIAEVVSGSRAGENAITSYAALIGAHPLSARIERAIVFGHPTLTRQVPALLKRSGVEVIVVNEHSGDYYTPSDRVRAVPSATIADDFDRAANAEWLATWLEHDRKLLDERAAQTEAAQAEAEPSSEALAGAAPAAALTREALVTSVWSATTERDRFVVAASKLVRVLDGCATPRQLTVHANRGLAGIDGTIATALGVASASQDGPAEGSGAGTTRVIIGDLALLHDAGSLLLPEAPEALPRVQVFVGNDGGGSIFDGLEVAATTPATQFERVMRTPKQANFSALAAAYGWENRRAENQAELAVIAAEAVTRPVLVEVPLRG